METFGQCSHTIQCHCIVCSSHHTNKQLHIYTHTYFIMIRGAYAHEFQNLQLYVTCVTGWSSTTGSTGSLTSAFADRYVHVGKGNFGAVQFIRIMCHIFL